MNRFDTECRRLIDGLVRELATLADDLAQTEIVAARAIRAKEDALRAKEEKKAAKAAPKVSARLARALERAEERRRLAAERRALKLAQRAARRPTVAADGQPAPSAGRGRGRPAAAPAPLVPPPLFVHKRSRDGSIQKLERGPAEEAQAAAVAVPS